MPDDARDGSDLPADTLNERVGVLTRREVEARILRPFVTVLSARYGADEVKAMLSEVVEAAATEVGEAMNRGDGSLEAFAEAWEPWFRGGALETEILELTPEHWSFNVTRCRYAELYRSLGMAELGATLSCNRDAALIKGFDPDVRLERTQTLMEGKGYCDFRYRRESD